MVKTEELKKYVFSSVKKDKRSLSKERKLKIQLGFDLKCNSYISLQ